MHQHQDEARQHEEQIHPSPAAAQARQTLDGLEAKFSGELLQMKQHDPQGGDPAHARQTRQLHEGSAPAKADGKRPGARLVRL